MVPHLVPHSPSQGNPSAAVLPPPGPARVGRRRRPGRI